MVTKNRHGKGKVVRFVPATVKSAEKHLTEYDAAQRPARPSVPSAHKPRLQAKTGTSERIRIFAERRAKTFLYALKGSLNKIQCP